MLSRLNDLIKKHQALSTSLLILLAVIVYQGVLACGFVLDDVALILQNPYIRNPHLWKQIFLGPMWAFLGHGAESSFYRPLGMLSIWLVCRVQGLNPVGFHFLQLSLYLLGIWMVFKIGRELLGSQLAAFAGALLWTVHPAHVEAAAWPSAIPDIGCGFFCLLGFWFFLRAEKQSPPALRHYVLAAAVFFARSSSRNWPLLSRFSSWSTGSAFPREHRGGSGWSIGFPTWWRESFARFSAWPSWVTFLKIRFFVDFGPRWPG